MNGSPVRWITVNGKPVQIKTKALDAEDIKHADKKGNVLLFDVKSRQHVPVHYSKVEKYTTPNGKVMWRAVHPAKNQNHMVHRIKY